MVPGNNNNNNKPIYQAL